LLYANILNSGLPLHRFAIVVCPVYEDPADQEDSPFELQNAQPFSGLSPIHHGWEIDIFDRRSFYLT